MCKKLFTFYKTSYIATICKALMHGVYVCNNAGNISWRNCMFAKDLGVKIGTLGRVWGELLRLVDTD